MTDRTSERGNKRGADVLTCRTGIIRTGFCAAHPRSDPAANGSSNAAIFTAEQKRRSTCSVFSVQHFLTRFWLLAEYIAVAVTTPSTAPIHIEFFMMTSRIQFAQRAAGYAPVRRVLPACFPPCSEGLFAFARETGDRELFPAWERAAKTPGRSASAFEMFAYVSRALRR